MSFLSVEHNRRVAHDEVFSSTYGTMNFPSHAIRPMVCTFGTLTRLCEERE